MIWSRLSASCAEAGNIHFNGTVLTVIGYYTGKRISLDLRRSWMRICWKPSPQMRKPMTATF